MSHFDTIDTIADRMNTFKGDLWWYTEGHYEEFEEYREGSKAPGIPYGKDSVLVVRNRYLIYGDYHPNGMVGIANVRYVEECEGIQDHVYHKYYYGGHEVFIDIRCDDTDLWERIAGLDDYCLLCEDTLSEVEREEERDAVEEYYHSDFVDMIDRLYGVNYTPEDKEAFHQLVYQGMSDSDTYGEASGIQWYFSDDDIKRIVEHIPLDSLKELSSEWIPCCNECDVEGEELEYNETSGTVCGECAGKLTVRICIAARNEGINVTDCCNSVKFHKDGVDIQIRKDELHHCARQIGARFNINHGVLQK